MINGKAAKDTLRNHLEADGAILKDLSEILSFGALVLAAPPPLSWAALAALIVKTAGSSISAASRIAQRLSPSDGNKQTITSYDRFRILFYLQCQQAYLEAVSNSKELHTILPATSLLDLSPLKKPIEDQIAVIEDAEVVFEYTVDPTLGKIPLFDAYSQWLLTILKASKRATSYSKGEAAIKAIVNEARARLKHALSSKDETQTWMRNFLALSAHDTTLNELGEIRAVLSGWKDPVKVEESRRQDAWHSYRQVLGELPDQRDSMYNEDFGVRKVFVVPEVSYHRAGMPSLSEQPQQSPNIGRLLGALVSNREETTELIILCGGPGSGKSTLCRMIAAELAKDDEIHPVFLRLRRVKEGEDIGSFVEESLRKLGVISRLSDLHTLSNVVLILDGFDELVMASKTRLRAFFNMLNEDITHGPLRTCKVILSGRDTLFPKGAGLPRGSHVITLLPFNRARVKRWSAKWRGLHPSGPGSTFHPEVRLADGGSTKSLNQLVSWPLTLHLLAKVHTAALFDFGDGEKSFIEKAYLYRSLMHETALRQVGQTDGIGRLSSDKMREFLREIAWLMYSRSRDSLAIEDVVPLAKRFFQDRDESALAELTEVAVVNAPEIKKGDDTGFEFVHKSFCEYLAAEYIARHLEEIAHKTEDLDGRETWFRDTQSATRHSASVFGVRALSSEVQEMLEPMLGAFGKFKRGENVKDIVACDARLNGLTRLQYRMNELLVDFLSARSISSVYEAVRECPLVQSPIDAYANYGVGIALVGIAAARMSAHLHRSPVFCLDPSDGALWKWLLLVHAGGIQLDADLGNRMRGVSVFRGDSVTNRPSPGDWGMPIKFGVLHSMGGYAAHLPKALERYFAQVDSVVTTLIASKMVNRLALNSPRTTGDAEGAQPRPAWELAHNGIDHLGEHALTIVETAREQLITELQRAGFMGPLDPPEPRDSDAALRKLGRFLGSERAVGVPTQEVIETMLCGSPKDPSWVVHIIEQLASGGVVNERARRYRSSQRGRSTRPDDTLTLFEPPRRPTPPAPTEHEVVDKASSPNPEKGEQRRRRRRSP